MAVILSSSWLKEKELSSDHVNQAVLAASCVDDNNEPGWFLLFRILFVGIL